MNILIFNWKDLRHPQVGGAEIIAFELAKKLVDSGHNVTFFCSSFKNCLQEEVIDGVKVIRKGSLYTVYFYAFRYYKRLKIKPDRVIEMINTICWQTWIYIPSSIRFAYLNQLAKEVWDFEFSWWKALLGKIFERIEYMPYKNSRFICYSRSTKEDLMSYGINKNKIKLFSLGIDHDRYRPGKKSKDPLFVFVARLVRMKRADICIKAMEQVSNKYKDAKLILVGNGPDEERLQDIIKSEKLEKNVSIVNKNNFYFKQNKKDIKLKYLQEAWSLVLPSVKEGWGMVVTEAAACGTTSIVSNVSGLRDSTNFGKTGLIVSSNPDPEEIANAMLELIVNEKRRKELENECLEWSKRFNWNKSFNEFYNIIK